MVFRQILVVAIRDQPRCCVHHSVSHTALVRQFISWPKLVFHRPASVRMIYATSVMDVVFANVIIAKVVARKRVAHVVAVAVREHLLSYV